MKTSKKKRPVLWLAGIMSAALLLAGCSTTETTHGTGLPNEPGREVKGYSQEGTSATAAPVSSGEMVSSDAVVAYEDHLIRLEKQYVSGSMAGSEFTYNIRVIAKRGVANVVVEEILPQGVTFGSATPAATKNADGNPAWKLGSMNQGETKTIAVKVTPTAVGEYWVCSVVRADPKLCLPIQAGLPKLTIAKVGPAVVEVGEDIIWNISVTNTGTAVAQGVTTQDLLPEKFTAVSPLSKNFGNIAPGETQTLAVTAKATAVGTYTNTATAKFAGGDVVEATAPVRVVQSGLAVEKTGPERGYIYNAETYNIKVTNTGDTTLTNVVVTDHLPDGAILYGEVADKGEVFDITEGKTIRLGLQNDARRSVYGYWRPGADAASDDTADQIVWKIDSLASGQSKTYQVRYYSKVQQTLVNRVTATSDRGLTAEDTAATQWIAAPGVNTNIIDSVDPIRLGEETILTITILNQSRYEPFTVTGNVVTVGDGLKPISASSGGVIDGQVVTFPSASLQPGRTIERTITTVGAKTGITTTKMETTTNFRDTPVIDQESTTVF